MSSFVYDKAREDFLNGAISFGSDTIKARLVTSGFTGTVGAASPTLADTATFNVGTDQTLASKTVAAGVANAANLTYSALTGSAVQALVLYKDTGTPSTSRLIAYLDSGAFTGLPFTPSGADETFSWDTGSNKIFKL